MGSFCGLESEIVSPGESEIFGLGEEDEFGEFISDHDWGAIFGVVVDHDDFEIGFVFCFAETLETCPGVFDGVPTADGDAKVEIRH